MVMGVKIRGQEGNSRSDSLPSTLINVVKKLWQEGCPDVGEAPKAFFHLNQVIFDGLVYQCGALIQTLKQFMLL
jgi:hypothetical protein